MVKTLACDRSRQISTIAKLISTVFVARRGSLNGESWFTDWGKLAVFRGGSA